MKNYLPIITFVFTLAACQSKPEASLEIKKDMVPVENAYNSSILTDVGTSSEDNSQSVKPVAPVRRASVKRKSSIPNRPITNNTEYPAPIPEAPAPVISNVPATNPETVNSGQQSLPKDNTEATIPAPRKKGWSAAAKGATIGAVGGAVAGAIISGKNRGKGAIIGGVIGAAGGYVLGRKKDKQSGRIDYNLN